MSASITSGTYPRAQPSLQGARPGLGARLWQALARAGARRAHPELLRMARLKAPTDPALAQQLREAARTLLQA